ncbi:MAG: hypothetical protein LUQ25_04120 [Methanoregulaceae archaeon]|nr:hypothetical protein [Methanoregulaceae archaeon]
MRRYALLFLLIAIACIGSAQAYLLNIETPKEIQVGAPLIVTGTSTFPAGFGFDIVLSFSQYTAQETARRSTAVGPDGTFSVVFDTAGLQGGQYKVEARISGEDESKLGSSSVTITQVTILDRQKELHITSSLTQELSGALFIEGTIDKIESNGVELSVLGPAGKAYGPQYIQTKTKVGSKDGSFSQMVNVNEAGNYYATFRDSKGYIGSATFVVTGPAATTTVATPPPTTIPASTSATTQSPAPIGALLFSLMAAGAVAAYSAGKKLN